MGKVRPHGRPRFVLLFVLLGLGALFLALSGGPARAQRASAEPPQAAAARRCCSCCALLVLGIAVPVAVIAAVEDRDDIPEAGVTTSRRCRSTAASCSASAAPTATRSRPPTPGHRSARTWTAAPPKELVLDAIENGRARGNGQMAAELVEGEDAEAVARVRRLAAGGPSPPPESGRTSPPGRRGAARSSRSFRDFLARRLRFRRSVRNHVCRSVLAPFPVWEMVMEGLCRAYRLLQCPAASAESPSDTGSGGPMSSGRIAIA